MDISFKLDPEVLIGSDTISMAGTIASRHGSRIMVAADHGLDAQLINRLKEILEDSGLEAIIFDGIEENSPVEMAENIIALSCAAHCDAIIGFGGYKAQIIARMAAIMAPMRLTAFELLDGRNYQKKILPLISIPTQGMDVFSLTDYFIAVDSRNKQLKTIKSPENLYTAVIIDSSLFNFLSSPGAAAIVIESFFFALESYCSTKANFLSDAVLEKALNFYIKLLRSGTNGINAEAAVTFAQANFLSVVGSSVSSPGVGAALSAAINARSSAAKPLCSAALFPVIAERLVSARPEKMARIASFLSNTKAASVAEAASSAVDSIRRTISALNVPLNLNEFSISLDYLTAAAEAARNLDFVTNSPWTVSEEEVFKILKGIL
jgi:alcohol dehydrogenase